MRPRMRPGRFSMRATMRLRVPPRVLQCQGSRPKEGERCIEIEMRTRNTCHLPSAGNEKRRGTPAICGELTSAGAWRVEGCMGSSKLKGAKGRPGGRIEERKDLSWDASRNARTHPGTHRGTQGRILGRIEERRHASRNEKTQIAGHKGFHDLTLKMSRSKSSPSALVNLVRSLGLRFTRC